MLMKKDSTSAVQWAKNCQGERREVTSGGMVIILRM